MSHAIRSTALERPARFLLTFVLAGAGFVVAAVSEAGLAAALARGSTRLAYPAAPPLSDPGASAYDQNWIPAILNAW